VTGKELIAYITENYANEEVVAFDVWVLADAMNLAGELGLDITDEQAKDAIFNFHEGRDAGMGLNWDGLEWHLCRVVENDVK
jgi:hypothetical protein